MLTPEQITEKNTDGKKTRNLRIARWRRNCLRAEKDGTRGRMVSQSQTAKDEELMYEESDMVGIEAIKLRRKYPALQKAWKEYKTIWHLVNEDN